MAAKKKYTEIELKIKNYIAPEINHAFQKSVSYSQYSMWATCPHRWALKYIENKEPYQASIHTVFGTAMHEALQNYLTVMYEESAAAADRIDIEEYFENKFRETYLKEYQANKSTHFSSPTEMREFFDDGMNILNFFKKKKGGYFSVKFVVCYLSDETIEFLIKEFKGTAQRRRLSDTSNMRYSTWVCASEHMKNICEKIHYSLFLCI